MEIATKISAFEYLLTQMLEWGKEMYPQGLDSSFTRLKALKLLFFASAVKNKNGGDLLDVFDNFYALPNGPVESDVYNRITTDTLTYYTFKDFSFARKLDYDSAGIDDQLKERLDAAIDALRSENEKIISYSAVQLVALSHCWLSWQNSIRMANALGKGSYRMSTIQIRNNAQVYTI
jgi:uncharacterized phage-associated protein